MRIVMGSIIGDQQEGMMELKPRQEDIMAFSSHIAKRKQEALQAEEAARVQAEITSRKQRYSDLKDFLEYAAKNEIDTKEYSGHNKDCLAARATPWQALSERTDGTPLTVEGRYVQLAVVSTRLDHSSQRVQTRTNPGHIEIRCVNHQEGFEGAKTSIITLFPSGIMLTGPDDRSLPFYDIDTKDREKKAIVDDILDTVLNPLKSKLLSEDPSLATSCMEE